jgi:hypothetical protein
MEHLTTTKTGVGETYDMVAFIHPMKIHFEIAPMSGDVSEFDYETILYWKSETVLESLNYDSGESKLIKTANISVWKWTI